MEVNQEQGKKYDSGKPLMALIEPDFIKGLAEILTLGARKYGLENWKNNLETYRIESALLRHYCAYKRGEKKDTESGQSHLLHLAVNAMFLFWYEQQQKEKSNNVVKTLPVKTATMVVNEIAAKYGGLHHNYSPFCTQTICSAIRKELKLQGLPTDKEIRDDFLE